MLRNKMMLGATLVLTLTSALVLASMASAHATATVTISHQMRGCHTWSFNSGPTRPSLSLTVNAGTVVRFVNNDVMPHKLVQLAGPKLGISRANMNKVAASTSIKLAQPGVYRFTTKPGEDYPWASAMHTKGEDYVLRLTLRVK
jgi:plastocyanin